MVLRPKLKKKNANVNNSNTYEHVRTMILIERQIDCYPLATASSIDYAISIRKNNALIVCHLKFDEKSLKYLIKRIDEEDIEYLDLTCFIEISEPVLTDCFHELISKCRLKYLYFAHIGSSVMKNVSKYILSENFTLIFCCGYQISHDNIQNKLSNAMADRNKKCLSKVNKTIICMVCIKKFRKSVLDVLDKDSFNLVVRSIWRSRNSSDWNFNTRD